MENICKGFMAPTDELALIQTKIDNKIIQSLAHAVAIIIF